MSTVSELEKQLQKAKEKETWEKEQQTLSYTRSLIGRCYKSIDNPGRYSKNVRVNSDHVQYIKVLGIYNNSSCTDDKNKINLYVHRIDITCTPVGWVRNSDGLGLRYQMHSNIAAMSKTKRQIAPDSPLQCGSPCQWNQITFRSGNENGSILYPDSRYAEPFREIEESEMLWAEDNLAEMSRMFYERFCCLFTKEKGVSHPLTPETEGIITQFDPASLKAIDDLLKANPSLDLQSLITVAKKEAKYNYFNGIKLPELVQYTLHGDHGLNLEILGGDGGTDYEPYTTHYYIESVNIDWPHILYPIRQKLSCGVYELTAKLRKLNSVYSPSSWNCQYSTYSYDASFEKAQLKKEALQEVNKLIANHIKTNA